MSNPIKVAIITVSDTCSKNENIDTSGQYLEQAFNNQSKYTVIERVITSDDLITIQEKVLYLCKDGKCDLIVLNGGTGFTNRDVTPESVKPLFTKEAYGIQIALITESLKKTKFAALSRLVSGIRDQTLILTFPGSLKACKECFEIVEPILEHAVDQLRSDFDKVKNEHNDKRLLNSKANVPSMVERYNNMPKSKISFNEAATLVIKEAIKRPKEYTYLNVEDYLNFGYYNVDEIRSPMNLPPFRASLKDGYALRSVDGDNDRFTMSKQISAGISDCEKLKENYCYRINTGAYIPDDSDCVIKVEDTELIDQVGDEYKIRIKKLPKPNDDIKPIGADLKLNDLLLENNTELTTASFALLASVNYNKIKVFKKPKISVLSTGDELLICGRDEYRLPCIYDSNRTLIKNLLSTNHYTDLIDLGIANDELNNLYHKLIDAFEQTDLLITSGGVSMGEKDYLKLILQSDFNAKIHFSRVNIKPGMPFVFATLNYKDRLKYVFALPGNPVSSFVICSLFVLPALKLMIKEEPNLDKYLSTGTDFYDLLKLNNAIYVKLNDINEFKKFASDNRPEFVRCLIKFNTCLDFDKLTDLPISNLNLLPTAYLINEQQHSSKLLSIQGANALVLIDPNNRTQICKAILI